MSTRDPMRRIIEIDRRIRSGTYPHPDALAQELEVSRRVIFRDRGYLVNVLGAPLEFHPVHKGWYYTETNYALPSTLVTRGELLAFLLATEAAQHQLGQAIEKELHEVVLKIGRSLEGVIEVDWEQLRQHFSVAAPASIATSLPTVLALHEAIERRRVVEMNYLTASRGARTRRQVHPHHLQLIDGECYLVAFDPPKAKMLTFNTGRISDLKLLTEGFTRQSDFSPHDWNRTGFRIESSQEIFDVCIRFDTAQAIYIRERQWHATQETEELPDGGLLLLFRASGLGEITRWVLQYGSHAEVLAPAPLRERVQAEVRAMTRIYEGNQDVS